MKKGKKLGFVLNPNNLEHLQSRLKTSKAMDNYCDFLALVAQALDLAISGEDIFLTIGITRDKSGLLMTITWDGDKTFLVAGSLASLSDEARAYLAEE